VLKVRIIEEWGISGVHMGAIIQQFQDRPILKFVVVKSSLNKMLRYQGFCKNNFAILQEIIPGFFCFERSDILPTKAHLCLRHGADEDTDF
jgi:hypothetical protein